MAIKLKPRDKVINWINKQVDDQHLRVGDKLPSERSLSEELGVSRTAVRGALDYLEESGGLVATGQGKAREISKRSMKKMAKKQRVERKLFGTDGIRGTANEYPIIPEVALRVGKAIAAEFMSAGHNNNVVIGKDTRLSGYMLETALTSGLVSMGMNVLLVGPVTTPAVAHLTRSMGAAVGIMLTASHNPYTDNGIKIFGADGYKLSDEHEARIEEMILNGVDSEGATRSKIGKALRIEDARGRYIEFAKTALNDVSLDGLRIVLDCANGSGYFLAPLIFKELGAEVIKIAVEPDGININHKCGATYPEKMAKAVVANNADVGIALDGDADRVIFCDAKGNVVDGDKILAMCAIEMNRQGKLANETLVVTTMSNIGLHIAMKEQGIKTITTDVGDRYVIESMRENGYNLGGEQSGHIIFADFGKTGDGIVSALKVLELMHTSGESVEELAKCMRQYPQKLVSLPVKEKRPIEELVKLNKELYKCHTELGDQGRTVVRYSGTENKIRLLVESVEQELTDKWIKRLTDAVLEEIG
jgi:phosphoglucosamine mutase